ncbi:ATP synthase subunit d, mitochondrial-like [Gigantopelta aegis]|uniref:ATP synthase subunit d, mitochondrial-like n=1 Tax=Gigantopelta aegis TaxID=1735272 RepID=UPI001B88BE7A|nr:ATP synthase subunit d, mitochondrial-like [Gigantopelta aegis]
MAARRLVKSSVDWIAFAERVPENQKEFFKLFKTKCEGFVNKVHQYPETLPKINFDFYKTHLASPTVAQQFEQSYQNVKVPYPKDPNNLMKEIEKEEQQAEVKTKEIVSTLNDKIKDAQALLSKIDSIPPPEEMTMEMYAYYFPDKMINPNKPTFWPHTPNMQIGHKDSPAYLN